MAKNVTGDTIYLSYYYYKFNVTLHLHLMEFQALHIFKVQLYSSAGKQYIKSFMTKNKA